MTSSFSTTTASTAATATTIATVRVARTLRSQNTFAARRLYTTAGAKAEAATEAEADAETKTGIGYEHGEISRIFDNDKRTRGRTVNRSADSFESDDIKKETSEKVRGAAEKLKLNERVRQRLAYMHDAYAIAQCVTDMLDKNRYDEALHMTRMASKQHKVAVCWNLVIDHQMRNDRLNDAIKLYNEMKKRGQLPSTTTYTTIFRGCALSRHPKNAVQHATRIYNSMLSNERIVPNRIHMNAVINVCARAKDIDSMFNIAATADNRSRVPDSITYGTLLNGMRHATVKPHHRPNRTGDSEDAVFLEAENASLSVARGRAVWGEVAKNWHQGVLVIDEQLVCAMGRLLLLGSKKDNDDILSLVEQTIGIPRPDKAQSGFDTVKYYGEETNEAADADANANANAEAEADADASAYAVTAVDQRPVLESTSDFAQMEDMVLGPAAPEVVESAEFFSDPDAPRRSSFRYVQPGNNILSVIISSLGTTRKTSLAPVYWDILTAPPYNVQPDSENWYRLLRTLRRGHASKTTAEMMKRIPSEFLEPKTFQVAMSCCAADNLNPNAFESAGQILDLMVHKLVEPDPHTMRLYLQTAITCNSKFRNETDPVKRQSAKFAFGRQLVRALARLWDPFRRASNVVSYAGRGAVPQSLSPTPEEKNMDPQMYNARRELMALARQMVSAADMVVSENMAGEKTVKDLRVSRNLLNRQITRFYAKREEIEPNLKKGKQQPNNQKGQAQTKKAGKKRAAKKKSVEAEVIEE
ncbi:hypothetical protein SPBR_00281 [Sporothrix brasiliensis 5110]|uniref:Pentatricopeptide repeat protein n=1 Tax=Sporothrix brasiliensis 5110 TaxID=1398154 RepID=A0A0C2ITS1_9PEZI|nr:uncharacterized protein SPBR_00281 [Sporothrix brasiliensis 5110]KIH90175.1 hypothetical protein SPBR_00281 [Sporothrix brasiliensis 5110]